MSEPADFNCKHSSPARSRMVETGILEGWMVQITKGLSPGDRLIVVGHRSVEEGQEVAVVQTVSDIRELMKASSKN